MTLELVLRGLLEARADAAALWEASVRAPERQVDKAQEGRASRADAADTRPGDGGVGTWGHSLTMNSLLESHSPSFAQPAHDSWWSVQTVVHRPHEPEHSRAMKLGSAGTKMGCRAAG